MECPWCHSKKVYAEFINVGIGLEQVTPYQCEECGSVQTSPWDDTKRLDEEEKAFGWHKPPKIHDHNQPM